MVDRALRRGADRAMRAIEEDDQVMGSGYHRRPASKDMPEQGAARVMPSSRTSITEPPARRILLQQNMPAAPKKDQQRSRKVATATNGWTGSHSRCRRSPKCDVLSLPCCIHLVGRYDFLAVLPKLFKCVDIESAEDIDEVVLAWIREAYHLR